MKSFEIGYGDDKVIIHPRMASIAEVEETQRQLNELAEDSADKYQREFELCRDALDSWSKSPAEKLVKEKGEFKPVKIEGGLKAHYAERSPENERCVREAYQIVCTQFRPDSRFVF